VAQLVAVAHARAGVGGDRRPVVHLDDALIDDAPDLDTGLGSSLRSECAERKGEEMQAHEMTPRSG
jgi:hypothetical protein